MSKTFKTDKFSFEEKQEKDLLPRNKKEKYARSRRADIKVRSPDGSDLYEWDRYNDDGTGQL